MSLSKKNITSIFFVPTLKIGRERLTTHGYIGGYQKDVNGKHDYDNCIYILFKPENIDLFQQFLEEEYERTKSVIDDYDYDGGYIVVIYQLDDKFKRDFDLIRNSKYSKTSAEFQALFPKTVKIKDKRGFNKDEISLQYRVFNKTEDLKEYWEEKLGVIFDDTIEFWEGYEEENEILDIEKIKSYV